jgi:hypothetical protein
MSGQHFSLTRNAFGDTYVRISDLISYHRIYLEEGRKEVEKLKAELKTIPVYSTGKILMTTAKLSRYEGYVIAYEAIIENEQSLGR